MSNQKEKTTAQAAGMNRAKPYQLVLFPMNNGATNVYYILTMNFIAYYANGDRKSTLAEIGRASCRERV